MELANKLTALEQLLWENSKYPVTYGYGIFEPICLLDLFIIVNGNENWIGCIPTLQNTKILK